MSGDAIFPLLSEIYAACIVEYAKQQEGGILKGAGYSVIKYSRDFFNLPHSDAVIKSSFSILEKLGCLNKYSHDKIQTYYLVDSNKFFSSMKMGAFSVRMYHIAGAVDDDVKFQFLESYADLGADFLYEAVESHDKDFTAISELDGELAMEDTHLDEVSDVPVDSAAWTGRKVVPIDHDSLLEMLREVEGRLDQLPLPNSEKASVRAHVMAAKMLADSPDPPDTIIWELISRANQICGVASLFVSILALFSAAGH